MSNPFTYTKNPQNSKEMQRNANYYHYEMQGAQDDINKTEDKKNPQANARLYDDLRAYKIMFEEWTRRAKVQRIIEERDSKAVVVKKRCLI
jgi:hypothetical protein